MKGRPCVCRYCGKKSRRCARRRRGISLEERLTVAEIAEAVESFDGGEGMTRAELARLYGVSWSTINAALRRAT